VLRLFDLNGEPLEEGIAVDSHVAYLPGAFAVLVVAAANTVRGFPFQAGPPENRFDFSRRKLARGLQASAFTMQCHPSP
jgi:hypothetical protein